jgi:hypothetical protein
LRQLKVSLIFRCFKAHIKVKKTFKIEIAKVQDTEMKRFFPIKIQIKTGKMFLNYLQKAFLIFPDFRISYLFLLSWFQIGENKKFIHKCQNNNFKLKKNYGESSMETPGLLNKNSS